MCIYTRLYASLEVFSRLQSKGIPKQPHGAFLLSPLRFYDSLLPEMNSSLNNPFKVIEGTVVRVLKTGTTKYAKQWASISTSNSGGHTGTALVRGESFPVTGLEHWVGLKIRLVEDEKGIKVLPISRQPEESVAEASARSQGEQTCSSNSINQDHPLDGLNEFKHHQAQGERQMLNDQHWRLVDRVMKLENKLGNFISTFRGS